jgi:DNA modification methylase
MTDWRDRIVGFERIPANQLLAHPNNARRHPAKQREALRGSLDTLGWYDAVIYNRTTGYLVDGHARVEEALTRNDEMPLPVLVVELDEHEEAQALASHDFISYMAEYDRDTLDTLLHDVASDDERVQAMLSELAEREGVVFGEVEPEPDPGAQIDRAEELREKWQTERGQLWVIPSKHGGEHRLLCGDSTDAGDVERVIAGLVTPLMVTDPPYGVEYDQDWRSQNRIGKVANDDNASWLRVWELSPSEVAYVWHAYWHAMTVFTDLEQAGFQHRAQIIWNKSRHVFSQGHYHWKHEPCFYTVRKGKTANWAGDRKQNTVWDIEANMDAPGNHGTQKPVECTARPIRNHQGNVYDPFGGSGTTMVACEQLGRQCRMIEIEPKYVAVILERMAGMGLEPRLSE